MLDAHSVGTLAPLAAAGLNVHARLQVQEAGEIAALKGQVADEFVIEHAAERGVRGCHQRSFFGDGNRLGLLTRLQGEVDADLHSDLNQDVLALKCLEALVLGLDGIGAGRQVGRVVLAGIVAGQSSGDASLRIRDGNRGAGNRASALIGDAPDDATHVSTLRMGGQTQQEQSNTHAQQTEKGTDWIHKHPFIFTIDLGPSEQVHNPDYGPRETGE